MDVAVKDNRAVVSEDTDFSTFLGLRDSEKPSFILLRHMPDRSAAGLLQILLSNIGTVETDLASGAVVVIEPAPIRVRKLPMDRQER